MPLRGETDATVSFSKEMKVKAKDKEVNGKGIIELLTLGAEQGTDIRIIARRKCLNCKRCKQCERENMHREPANSITINFKEGAFSISLEELSLMRAK
ncbi:MAG: HPr family phosphocarrier protein [Candidatus Brocadiales bacterium]